MVKPFDQHCMDRIRPRPLEFDCIRNDTHIDSLKSIELKRSVQLTSELCWYVYTELITNTLSCASSDGLQG
jgi:hypothetical protein